MNELRLAKDTLYHYKLESRDVLHNFSVPVFRLKQDSIPGREITGWFEPTQTGDFMVQCAEICGIGHGLMGARVIIEEPEAHTAWMTSMSSGRLAEAAPLPSIRLDRDRGQHPRDLGGVDMAEPIADP